MPLDPVLSWILVRQSRFGDGGRCLSALGESPEIPWGSRVGDGFLPVPDVVRGRGSLNPVLKLEKVGEGFRRWEGLGSGGRDVWTEGHEVQTAFEETLPTSLLYTSRRGPSPTGFGLPRVLRSSDMPELKFRPITRTPR